MNLSLLETPGMSISPACFERERNAKIKCNLTVVFCARLMLSGRF